MLVLDQFLYTAAATRTKSGYQVIARSSGISEEIVSELSKYVFPLGIDPSEFKESRSLLILKNNKIAFSKVRNIGIGYDGRSDTFYNHTFVMDFKDFKKLDNDTRILENFYIENSTIQGSLPQQTIEAQKIPLNLEGVEQLKPILRETLLGLFSKKKIAIFDVQKPHLVQKILGLVPPSVRLISFSTLVNDVEKQSGYGFIITDKLNSSLLDEKFKKIDPSETMDPSLPSDHFEECIAHILELMDAKQISTLTEIYDGFEKISSSDFKSKIMMLTFLDKLKISSDKTEKQDFAYVVFDCLRKLDEKTALQYFNKIKEFLHFEDVQRYAPELEISQILVDSATLPIEKNRLENWLGQISDGTSESRMKLLNELFVNRKNDFITNGSNLLIDSRYSFYRPNIYRFFVETKELHSCIFETFENEELTYLNKQKISEAILIQSAKNDLNLLSKLIDYKIFNLEDKYEAKDFLHILEEIFEMDEVYNADFKLSISLIEKIYSKVDTTLFQDKKSGTLVLPNSTIKQLVKIIKLLKRFLDNYDSKKLTESQKHKLTTLRDNYREFIKRNDIDESPSWNPFSYFG